LAIAGDETDCEANVGVLNEFVNFFDSIPYNIFKLRTDIFNATNNPAGIINP
jgi:hypothetical protein